MPPIFHAAVHALAQLFCRLFLRPFIKAQALPQPLPELDDLTVFILAKPYAADELALQRCLMKKAINPLQVIALPQPSARQAPKLQAAFVAQLQTLHAQHPQAQFIPVNVCWGRSPRKVKTVMQAYLANSWSVPGRIKRAIFLLLQLRQVSCYFGQAIDMQALLNTGKTPSNAGATIFTDLSQRFIQQKEAVIGPDLSHQRMLGEQVLHSKRVSDCIAELERQGEGQRAKLEKKADKYLREMASDYSYPVVRVFDILLSWLWERLYQGVEVKGMENVQGVAADHELVYVPCHRSHIDYLLLSYVIFHKGLMPPHIAAGINLNLPVVGGLLRRGGAFFIRRQFRDNKLYRAVLESYVACMCQQGFAMEYFIEGGRSRTGFLLQPKPGMLAMTLRAAQDQRDKPLVFLPVYIGYERLLESHSYINELYGEKKQKESLMSLLSARHYLKEDYGKVYMSVGEPIFAADIWQRSGFVEGADKPKEGQDFFNCVDLLGQTIQTEINNAAFLSPLNFIATALLSSKRRALPESQLHVQIQLLQSLTALPGYRDTLQQDSVSADKAIKHALELNVMQRNANSLGDIYFLNQQAQVSATFLRNNSLHVFILPALVASVFTQVKHTTAKRLQTICQGLYPYIKSEFFLPWQADELDSVIDDILARFMALNLIHKTGVRYQADKPETESFHALMVLAGAGKASIELFYITAEVLIGADNGHYTKQTLELACAQMAERLSLLHEFHAPDFFDKNLFRTFIMSLVKEGILAEDDNQQLFYQRPLLTAKKLDNYVLSPSVKRSIKQVTQQPAV